ncbi:MAG: hypothetical protein ACYDHP_14765 [Ferrimicrobium sp.]
MRPKIFATAICATPRRELQMWVGELAYLLVRQVLAVDRLAPIYGDYQGKLPSLGRNFSLGTSWKWNYSSILSFAWVKTSTIVEII